MSKKILGFGQTRKCPICSKTFYTPGEEWAYANRAGATDLYFCSWTCFRKDNLMRYGDKRGRIIKWQQETYYKKGDNENE